MCRRNSRNARQAGVCAAVTGCAGLIALAAGGSAAVAATSPAGSKQQTQAAAQSQETAKTKAVRELPDMLQLTAVVRDFFSIGPMAHPDFALPQASTRTGIAAAELGPDGKPTLLSRTGSRYTETTSLDAKGSPIHPLHFDPQRSDQRGPSPSGDGTTTPMVDSSQTFDQWFRDVPGVNRTASMPFMMFQDHGTGMFVFDSDADYPYTQRGGYFPIDGQLMGDSRAHNYGFTTEIAATFVYNADSPQRVTFSGDDDVFIYIDNRLVIELVAAAENSTQTFDLSRLKGLRDGQRYSFRLFHAERRCCASNFRLETTLLLEPDTSPNTTISVTGVETDR